VNPKSRRKRAGVVHTRKQFNQVLKISQVVVNWSGSQQVHRFRFGEIVKHPISRSNLAIDIRETPISKMMCFVYYDHIR
jgi:hypothetical protein